MTDNRTIELREAARNIQGNLGRCLYRRKDVDEMQKVCDLLFGAADIIESIESGTLTAEQVRETVEKHWHDLPDEYDMPEATALPEYSYDWQAIADELNTRAERTCVPTEDGCCPYCGDDLIKCDMAIGEGGGAVELDPPIYHNYCPNCGARVMGE